MAGGGGGAAKASLCTFSKATINTINTMAEVGNSPPPEINTPGPCMNEDTEGELCTPPVATLKGTPTPPARLAAA